jgi:hypothetical protein
VKAKKKGIEIRILDVSNRASVTNGPAKPTLRLEKQRIGFVRSPRRRILDDKYIRFYDV